MLNSANIFIVLQHYERFLALLLAEEVHSERTCTSFLGCALVFSCWMLIKKVNQYLNVNTFQVTQQSVIK